MRFTPSFLDEIRARVPVSEVVRQKVKLRKEGREWRGLSPFNAEKTPSFFVNDQKGFFHDFSSGKHGDGFAFLMETEGVSFPEAVERLAAMAGLPMPVETQEQREQDQRRASLREVLDWAAAFFEKQLAGPAGREARAYLDRRQIASPLRQQFRIGFAPAERHALRDYLAGKGASVEMMIEAGLLIHGDDIPVPYDRFRNRVMFPICDARGRVIAFGGRAMEADAHSPSKDGRSSERPIAKYLNSPETPLFHKGAALYNLHNARKAAHENGGVIAVEGYVDVIALTEAGFPQAVAPLGTALTPDQCGLLWKMAEEPVLCFDGDKAGLKAAWRAVDTALPLIGPGRSLRFVLLPEGKDPDELLRAGGSAAVADALATPLPLVDILWMRETQAAALDTPEQRAALERRLREIIREIPDETLRRHYDADIRERLNRLFGRDERRPASPRGGYPPQTLGRRSFGPRGGGFGGPPPVQVSPTLASSPLFRGAKIDITPREGLILLILMNHPELIETVVEELAGLDFPSAEAASFRDALLRWSELDNGGPALGVMLAESGFGPFAARLAGMSAHASLWNVRPDAAPADAAESLRQALVLHRRASALNRELRAVEARLAQNPNEQDAARLRDIQTQLTALDGAEAALEGFGASSGRASRTL